MGIASAAEPKLEKDVTGLKILHLHKRWLWPMVSVSSCNLLAVDIAFNYVPHHRRGHTFSCADPVGIASCLHSISLMNGWILAKLTQIYHWMGGKC